MGPAVDSRDFAALIFRVNVIGIRRVWEHPESVATIHIFPTMVGDSARILRIAYPRTVVLKAAVDPIRIFVVNAHVIKLRHGKIFPFPPFASAVVGIPHPAVISGEHGLRIRRVDPNIVVVTVTSLETANHSETLSAIFTQNQRAVGLEKPVGIFWIDNQPREIKRTPHHPIAFVALLPGRAAIIGNEQRARRRLHKTINAF